MNIEDRSKWLEDMSQAEINLRFGYVNMQFNNRLKSFDEYKEERRSHRFAGEVCSCEGCTNPAEYEGGDEDAPVGLCEKHAGIKKTYCYNMVYRPQLLIKSENTEGNW